ncbi:MAG: DUF4034 domain-containing protein [Verrucomicrobia bacterium]|nr:MAG: DUF4034 domain-containing protein [Verrucomicrobiota bacterium]
MNACQRVLILGALAMAAVLSNSCEKETYSPEKAALAAGRDLIMQGIVEDRSAVLALLEKRDFIALEKRASDLRTQNSRYENGAWKLDHFYQAILLDRTASSELWMPREALHRAWSEAFPQSVTAQSAESAFWLEYAWHARGSGFANEVSPEQWQEFESRLARARERLMASLGDCPQRDLIFMRIALASQSSVATFRQLFENAKMREPSYLAHDLMQAQFLMTDWYGEPGDWEAAALAEINRPSGLGVSGYALVVRDRRPFFDDVFRDTQASWALTRQGFEQLTQAHPASLELLNAYARLACIAQDADLAHSLFEKIDNRIVLESWGERKRFVQMRNWARDSAKR